jgi:hypothetical protein
MIAPVPGQERHGFAADLAERYRVGRRAVGRFHLDLAHLRKKRIKAEPPNTPIWARGPSTVARIVAAAADSAAMPLSSTAARARPFRNA